MAEVFSTSTDYLIGKSTESNPDRTIIEHNKFPTLFMLNETCKNLNESQLKLVVAYARELAEKKSI